MTYLWHVFFNSICLYMYINAKQSLQQTYETYIHVYKKFKHVTEVFIIQLTMVYKTKQTFSSKVI